MERNRVATVIVQPQTAPARWSSLLLMFAIALFIPAAAILLHESGHFVANAVLGYEVNRLTFANVQSGATPPGIDAAFADGISFAAGALVSLLLVGTALLSVAVLGPNTIALALVVFECIRSAVGFALQAVRSGLLSTVVSGFGELRYGVRGFGGPRFLEVVVSWIELAVPFAVLLSLLHRIPQRDRARYLIVVFAALTAGIVLWIGVVGPRVLPA